MTAAEPIGSVTVYTAETRPPYQNQHAAYGLVVTTGDDALVAIGKYLKGGQLYRGLAEYQGLVLGLETAHNAGAREVFVRSSSPLVVEQSNGIRPITGLDFIAVHRRLDHLRSVLAVTYELIPQDANPAVKYAQEAFAADSQKVEKKRKKKVTTRIAEPLATADAKRVYRTGILIQRKQLAIPDARETITAVLSSAYADMATIWDCEEPHLDDILNAIASNLVHWQRAFPYSPAPAVNGNTTSTTEKSRTE